MRFFSFSFLKAVGVSSAAAFKELMWSFGVLETGVWPDRNADGSECTMHGDLVGKPLTESGWTAALLFLKGDLEFMCNDVG